jgi:hypothetical protein
MPQYSPEDVNAMFEAIVNSTPLPQNLQQKYGLPESPSVSDIQSHIQSAISPTAWEPAYHQGQHPSPYSPSTFQPTTPAPEMLSLDEMMDIINRRTELATQPRVEALERSLEEQKLSGEKQIGDVTAGYERAKEDLGRQGNLAQQQGSRIMAARGIYDSGLAVDLANRIGRQTQQFGFQLGEEQARQLADISELLHLQTRHTMEEIQGIMGEKALMAQTMLDDLRQEQQARGDMLAQREFENWLAMQAHELNQWRANLEEYWREQGFEADQASQAWNQWYQEEQLRHQREQAEWDRIFNMNRWEAEYELQLMAVNNQISQQEFNNAMMMDEFNLKQWLYQAQNAPTNTTTTYYSPSSGGSTSGGSSDAWFRDIFTPRYK